MIKCSITTQTPGQLLPLSPHFGVGFILRRCVQPLNCAFMYNTLSYRERARGSKNPSLLGIGAKV